MKIRKATKEDFEDYYELQKEFSELEKRLGKRGDKISTHILKGESKKGKPRRGDKNEFIKRVKRKDAIFFAVEENGKMIAYLFGVISNLHPLKIKCGHIGDLIISKKYRGKGIATKLEKEFIKWLKKKRIKWGELNVSWYNFEARKTYEKLGYKNADLKMIKELK